MRGTRSARWAKGGGGGLRGLASAVHLHEAPWLRPSEWYSGNSMKLKLYAHSKIEKVVISLRDHPKVQ